MNDKILATVGTLGCLSVLLLVGIWLFLPTDPAPQLASPRDWMVWAALLTAIGWMVVLVLYLIWRPAPEGGLRARVASRARARPIATFGAAGLMIELLLGGIWLFLNLEDDSPALPTSPANRILPAVIVVAGLWFLVLVLSFIWLPGSTIGPKKGRARPPDATRGRVPFAVFFGYVLVGVLVGSVLSASTGQPAVGTGTVTSDLVVDGAFVVRMKTSSNWSLGMFESRSWRIGVISTLDFLNASAAAMQGSVVVSLTGADPPLTAYPMRANGSRAVLNTSVSSGMLYLLINPQAGLRTGNYTVTYLAQYNLTGATSNLRGNRTASFTLRIIVGGQATMWYLMFLFVGILTSFWWREANHYLGGAEPEGSEEEAAEEKNAPAPNNGGKAPAPRAASGSGAAKEPTEEWRLVYLLMVPIFSGVIAAVIFSEILPSLALTSDPFVVSLSGFVYGFFWENAAKKFGQSVTSVYGRGPKRPSDS